jgi:hypothetical protein
MMHRGRLPVTSLVSGLEQACRGHGVTYPRIISTKIKEQNTTDTQETMERESTGVTQEQEGNQSWCHGEGHRITGRDGEMVDTEGDGTAPACSDS